MPEKKAAIITISKVLAGVSFVTLAAIGSASGSMVIAGLTAVPAAIMTVGPALAKLKEKKEDVLELPVPPWWTSDTSTWNDLCTEIGDHLPHIFQEMAACLQKEQVVVTTQVVRQTFIEVVAAEQLKWEFDPQQRRMVAAEIATPVLQKVADVLKAAIEPLREDTALVDVHTTAANTEKMVEVLEKAILILENIQKQGAPATRDNTSVVVGASSTGTPQVVANAQSIPAVVDVLAQKIENDTYDVYICYHEADETEVFKIGEQLKAHGILPWFDTIDVTPGIPKRLQQEQRIEKIPAAAVFVGQHAVADWQALQMYSFIEQFIQRSSPVIPVLLADAPKQPKLPVFLANFAWVDFRRLVPDPIKQLMWGITGKRDTSR
jgi:hypothetical protein